MKVVTLGEIMLRLSPTGYERLVQANSLGMTFGGGEANVAVCLSNFGIDTQFISKLPQNEVGQCAINFLRRYGVGVDEVVRGGDRIGIYFLEKGASQRPSKVIYDRKNSSFATSVADEYDFDSILKGADWFHFTGITPALSKNACDICLKALKSAKKLGIKVSCDVNYRAKLWTKQEAKCAMEGLMPYVDVCICNEEDASNVFGISAENTDVCSGKLNKEGYVSVAKQLMQKFSLRAVAITLRQSISANDNIWSGLYYDGESHFSKEYPVHIVDRVGGGDSFCAGLIYALLNGYSGDLAVEFAVGTSCLKHSIEGDVNLVSVDEVNGLLHGNGSGRVQR